MMFPNAIALTGGIATGKSTVLSLMKLHGFKSIDADAMAHSVLKERYEDIARLFGTEYLVGKSVDRQKLGALIFNDNEAKKELEAFMHPLIKTKIFEEAHALERFNFPYFMDIPLFFETRNYDIEQVVVVYAPKSLQLQRLVLRNAFNEKEALARIESQMDIENKRALASFVVDNGHDLHHLQQECDRLRDFILKDR